MMLQSLFLVALCGISSVQAAPVTLLCQHAPTWYTQETGSAMVDIYKIDVEAAQAKQLAGLSGHLAITHIEVNEADITLVQDGNFSDPQLRETFRTVISRVTGAFVRYPHYLDADGRWLAGEKLETVARTAGKWGGFFGVRLIEEKGQCRPDDRKF